jgi:hypothetical protein
VSEEPDAKETTADEPDESAEAKETPTEPAEAKETAEAKEPAMATVASEAAAVDEAAVEARAKRTDRSQWNWLLIVPIVIPLSTVLYNRTDPTLFGIPFFYWVQLAFVVLGVSTTTIVYQATKRGGAR